MKLQFELIYPLLFFIVLIISCAPKKKHEFQNFITSEDHLLKDGDSTFRFISFNIPNLNFVEDEMEFTKPHAFRLPTSFEIKDALESVRQMGGNVVRSYTFPVRRKTDTLGIPRYVLGPGEFDENSFQVMDTVLSLANDIGVRLILPLLNNWKWMGGVPQYAEFRNKTTEEFWTDSLLISDFKKTIDFILNRTNTVTGVKYKDDKAILCWETGNELTCPYSWTEEIVTHIKSIDTNHLVMDGYHAIDGENIPEESIRDSVVDIVTTHQYKLNPKDIIEDITAQMNRVDGKKPYVIGEFGFLGTNAIREISEFIIENENISGGLIWSLRYHREEGGFYWHSEPLGGGIFKAFHWPGFKSGIDYNEEGLMRLIRQKSFKIREMEVPKLDIPSSPVLLPIDKISEISWRGATGAKSYDIERSESSDGPWEIVGLNVSDAEQTYTPLFNDVSAIIGSQYFYRIIAKNESGFSEPSNVVGPVKVNDIRFIDNMENLTAMYYRKGNLEIRTDNDREFKEIMSRIKAEKGSKLFYYVPGRIKTYRIYSFSKNDTSSLNISLSSDGKEYDSVKTKMESFYLGKGDYAYWIPAVYSAEIDSTSELKKYMRINVKELNQIARIEIDYVN